MRFNGILIRFDCTNNQQFDAIGEFWNFMTQLYSKAELKGLGFNWANNSFDYVIGEFEGKYDYSFDIISQTYPGSKNVVVELPDHGWRTYTGKLEDIANIYEAIYREGALDYEIEEFDLKGNCKISILRL
ncbi:hypothetical protein [Cellulosilyticum sp. I15G10I2]|uniref:hypothetical protein n=1 Tax=Cellulosilyticum sp. I15G10I2 TaxID=1892843 RepID=UPI00085C7049|nr:hypothetical protein [Cellulosilyticum sp. I15G10I2]